MAKKLKGISREQSKRLVITSASSENERMVWIFSDVDMDGPFRFDPNREDFDHKRVLDALIQYSKRTWAEVKKDTHDGAKSKHHFLSDATLSREAEERISRLKLEEDRDQIYSLHLTNQLRIIGLRKQERFIVKWYDPKHQFCPSTKK